MELSGALSNPQLLLEFSKLEALRGELLEKPICPTRVDRELRQIDCHRC